MLYIFNVNVEINNEYALEELLWGRGLKTFRYIIAEINNYLAYELNEEEFVAKHRR